MNDLAKVIAHRFHFDAFRLYHFLGYEVGPWHFVHSTRLVQQLARARSAAELLLARRRVLESVRTILLFLLADEALLLWNKGVAMRGRVSSLGQRTRLICCHTSLRERLKRNLFHEHGEIYSARSNRGCR